MLVARGWFESPVKDVLRNVKITEDLIDWEDHHGKSNLNGKNVIATIYLDKDFNGPSTIFYVTAWKHQDKLEDLVTQIKKPQPKPASSPAIKAKKTNVQRGSNKKNNGTAHITKPT